MMKYLYLVYTLAFTVYGQLIIKWQIKKAGDFPQDYTEKILFLVRLLINPWIISSFIGAFLAALCWMVAMTKFELSYAYPFISLTFVLVLFFSGILFHESISLLKIVGVLFIITGVIVGSLG